MTGCRSSLGASSIDSVSPAATTTGRPSVHTKCSGFRLTESGCITAPTTAACASGAPGGGGGAAAASAPGCGCRSCGGGGRVDARPQVMPAPPHALSAPPPPPLPPPPSSSTRNCSVTPPQYATNFMTSISSTASPSRLPGGRLATHWHSTTSAWLDSDRDHPGMSVVLLCIGLWRNSGAGCSPLPLPPPLPAPGPAPWRDSTPGCSPPPPLPPPALPVLPGSAEVCLPGPRGRLVAVEGCPVPERADSEGAAPCTSPLARRCACMRVWSARCLS
eukprot:366036-Chlamydomonas_euryale.AAC.3